MLYNMTGRKISISTPEVHFYFSQIKGDEYEHAPLTIVGTTDKVHILFLIKIWARRGLHAFVF